MQKLFTAELVNQIQFYQMPKSFFHNPKYIPMKNDAKLAYMLIRDLLTLSIQNDWVNERNEVFVKLSRNKLMDRLQIKGTQKFAQVMKELVDYELIVYKQVGLNKCNEIYICIPEDLATTYSDKELLDLDNIRKFENQTSGSLKIKPQEVRKSNLKKFENQTHIKTKDIKTKDIKTQSISQKKTERPTDFNKLKTQIEEQVHIEHLKQEQDPDFVDELILNICDMYNSDSIKIGQQNVPQSRVRANIKELKHYHLEHVIRQYNEVSSTTTIRNVKGYLQAVIYNSVYEAHSKIQNDIRAKGLI